MVCSQPSIPKNLKNLVIISVNSITIHLMFIIDRLFNPEDGIDRTLDIPENIIPVAAIGFVAGLAGQIFG